MLAATIRGAAPILLAALGETFVERSGLLNLGVEGMMVAGAFTSFVVGLWTDHLLLGFASAGLAGLLLGLVFGVLTIGLKVNQIVVGLGLTILLDNMCSFSPSGHVRPAFSIPVYGGAAHPDSHPFEDPPGGGILF